MADDECAEYGHDYKIHHTDAQGHKILRCTRCRSEYDG